MTHCTRRIFLVLHLLSLVIYERTSGIFEACIPPYFYIADPSYKNDQDCEIKSGFLLNITNFSSLSLPVCQTFVLCNPAVTMP